MRFTVKYRDIVVCVAHSSACYPPVASPLTRPRAAVPAHHLLTRCRTNVYEYSDWNEYSFYYLKESSPISSFIVTYRPRNVLMRKFVLSAISVIASLVCVTGPAYAGIGHAVSFPSVPNIPVASDLSFHGFFRHHQPVKILFAIGQPGGQTSESLINAALVIKYLESKGYRYKIHFVFYSKGVLVADRLNQRYSAGWAPLIEALHRKGVTFSVCHNAMVLLHVKRAEVFPFMQIAPAGILSVVEYQDKGYVPIFNPNSVTGAAFIHPGR